MNTIQATRQGALLYVMLDRPDVRNCFNGEMVEELTRAFRSIPDDVRAVVLAGGGKVFCAGADAAWLASALDLPNAKKMAGMLRTIDECPAPVIARIQGAAFGGGMGLAAACDIVVAAQDAKFGFTEVRLGILPAAISSFSLRKVGPSAARRYFLTAEAFGAEEARRIGLVHEVVPEDQLDMKVQSIVDTLMKNGPRAVREAKAMIRRVSEMDRDQAPDFTAETIARVRATPEAQEGLKAFLEKRRPNWIA